MELNLNGKVAVVTGGTSGIGKAALLEYAREGCRVAFCARTPENVRAVEAELRELGAEVCAEALDVADLAALKAFADRVHEQFGRLDIWVNNAGLSRPGKLWELSEEDYDFVMDADLKAVFFGTQYATDHMRRDGNGGVVINVSSFAATIPTGGRSLYSAAKCALISLTRTFAGELAPYGIRVVAVSPGVTETLIIAKELEKLRDVLINDIAARRIGVPEEIAKPMVFLSSDACSYISGVQLEISGGKFCVQSPEALWR